MATNTASASYDVSAVADAVGDAQPELDGCMAVVEAAAAAQSNKAADKKARQKAHKRLAAEFTQAMAGSIDELEGSMQRGSAAQKDLAKQRRLQLREVLKAVTDPSSSSDERLRFLQGKYVHMVQELNRQDRDMLALQAQLDSTVKESAQSQAELSRAHQKVDNLQRLARTLQAENKLLEETNKRSREEFAATAELIRTKVASQSEESNKLLALNKALAQENEALRGRTQDLAALLEEQQFKVEALGKLQREQVEALQHQLDGQAELVAKSQEAHTHLGTLLEENKLLRIKADTFEQQAQHLERLNQVYKENMEATVKKAEAGLGAAVDQKQLTDKLQKQLEEYQSVLSKLLKERKALQQDVAGLQGRVKQQGEELRRSQRQKQQLEELCRALQARSSGGSDGSSSHASEAEDVEALCSRVVQAAIAAVVAQHIS